MNENLQITLSIWGAVLSTFLAVLTIIKYRKDYKANFFIMAKSENDFELIDFSVCNKSKKPITLKSYSIGLGSHKSSQSIVIDKNFEEPIKLYESDICSRKISRQSIVQSVKTSDVLNKQFQRIWLNIKLTTGKEYSETVYINPTIIEKEYYNKAEQFIAADIFLGFEQKESITYPIGLNK